MLKDWKKVEKDEWIKNMNRIRINGNNVHFGHKRIGSLYGGSYGSKFIIERNKHFKTKSQALKFAKSYMRTH